MRRKYNLYAKQVVTLERSDVYRVFINHTVSTINFGGNFKICNANYCLQYLKANMCTYIYKQKTVSLKKECKNFFNIKIIFKSN